MFRFLCQQLIRPSTSRASLTTTIPHVCYLQTQSLKSKSESVKDEKSLITVPYLVNSFGFSLESATKVSKKIKIKSLDEADSVVELFRVHGFSDAEIANFIRKRPSLLLADAEKTLQLKIEYFKSLGMPTADLVKIISRQPRILMRDLKNQIIPTCNFLKTFVHTDIKLIYLLKTYAPLLLCNLEEVMIPNISILQSHGIPDSHISRLIMMQPSTLMHNPDRVKVGVAKARELGFDPTSMKFNYVLEILVSLRQSIWKQKIEAYKSFGWSDEEFSSTFKLQPFIMKSSEKKIRKLMDFFVTILEWKPSVVCKYPNLMLCNLEKRIIPRCSVLQLLMSKGLVKKDLINIPSELTQNGKTFLNKFVMKYQDKIPGVVDAHQGKIEFQGFQNESKDETE